MLVTGPSLSPSLVGPRSHLYTLCSLTTAPWSPKWPSQYQLAESIREHKIAWITSKPWTAFIFA